MASSSSRPASGSETQSPRPYRLGGQLPHPCQISRCRRLPVGTPLAHDVHPQRRMGQVGRHVDVQPAGGQGVEVLREGLPGPGQPVGHHDAGDVLDPGHHVHQHVVILAAARREPDPAVAHHRGGHAVCRRRDQPVRPDGLAVIVGVQIHEAGRDQQPGGIDLASAPFCHGADRGDHRTGYRHIADVRFTTEPVDDGAVADDQLRCHTEARYYRPVRRRAALADRLSPGAPWPGRLPGRLRSAAPRWRRARCRADERSGR